MWIVSEERERVITEKGIFWNTSPRLQSQANLAQLIRRRHRTVEQSEANDDADKHEAAARYAT